MIKKLRFRTILISMISIAIVLSVIMGGICLVVAKSSRNYADNVLKTIADNDGKFPMDFRGNERDRYIGINPTIETPFDTRYFVVKYDSDGSVKEIDTQQVTSVENADAMVYANKVINRKASGTIDNYRYLVKDTMDGGKIVVFMDYSRQDATNSSFVRVSFLFSAVALVFVFLLLLLFSKRILRPIEKSYEKQKNFISDASHELKTPMAIISANNELIEMEYGESESTNAISKQITRMVSMTKNLTALSKIDEIESLSERKKIDLSTLINDVAEPYTTMADNFNININLEDNTEIVGDEGLLRQMFSLLLDNAIKYGKSYVNILSASNNRKSKNEINIEIRNDADNIVNGNYDKCFDRFYRSDEVRASGIEGSGIGLSIVKEIVELHNGKISAAGDNGDFVIDIKFVTRAKKSKQKS